MLGKLYKAMKKKDGFTLVELMVVVVIIGILAGIAVPVYNNTHTNAANQAHAANVRTLIGAAQMSIANEGIPDADVTWNGVEKQGWEDYIAEWPTIPEDADTSPGTFKGNVKGQGGVNYEVVIDTSGSVTVQAAK